MLTASTNDSEVDSSFKVSFSISSNVVEIGPILSSLTLITVSSGSGLLAIVSMGITVLFTGRRGRCLLGATARPFRASSKEMAS